MFGLDDRIAAFSDGTSIWIVLAIAILLGLRHATDPDHLAAVTTLVASGRERAARRAGELGLAWGVGHAVTLFAFGLPILLLNAYLPERVQQAAETAIGFVIVYLAVRLLIRWRRGAFHLHGERTHVHLPGRTRLGAFGIGLVHGMGGSAGVGVLLVASIRSTPLAVASLAVLAVFTAVSMTMLSTGFGLTLVARPIRAAFGGVAPALGVSSFAFGIWYAAAAWSLMPYPF
jgi:High-affinity nickel-transport protein